MGRRRLAPEQEYNFHRQKDIDVKIIINRCDLCNDHLTQAPDDIEAQIAKLVEVNNSYESEYDRQDYVSGPRLLLCSYCQIEYLIQGYPFSS